MLIDTNIVSYFFKRDTRAASYEPHLRGQMLYVSFMTVAELYRWPVERGWGEAKRQSLIRYLRNYTVLPFDEALAWSWAELTGKTCRQRPLSFQDSWIAATALRHGLPVVTHNRQHFEQVSGLTVISEA